MVERVQYHRGRRPTNEMHCTQCSSICNGELTIELSHYIDGVEHPVGVFCSLECRDTWRATKLKQSTP